MSIRKKFLLIFLFVLLDSFLLIGFFVIRDATMLNQLKKEIQELSKLDISKDRYNRSIVCRGEYAIVEKAIKDYLDKHAVLMQDSLKVLDDEKFKTILSYDNYVSDGPDFKDSYAYLANLKTDFNQDIDLLISDLNENNISNYINDKISDFYFQKLYKDLMLSDKRKDEFIETTNLLYKTRDYVNSMIDDSIAVLDFLSLNKESWTVENGEIKFLTEDLYNQYVYLISNLKKDN